MKLNLLNTLRIEDIPRQLTVEEQIPGLMGIEEIFVGLNNRYHCSKSIAEHAIIVCKTLNQLWRGYNPNKLPFT
jgi:hypothetical protein